MDAGGHTISASQFVYLACLRRGYEGFRAIFSAFARRRRRRKTKGAGVESMNGIPRETVPFKIVRAGAHWDYTF